MDLVYNPLDYGCQDDPYPIYARLRDEAPAYYNEELDFWAISRHTDVAAALRDSTRYSNSHGPLMERQFWNADSAKMHSIVAMDPPQHTEYRSLISGSFSPRAVRELEARIRAATHRYVDAAVECGQFDIVSEVARPIPFDAISMVVGVPESERAEAQRLLYGTVVRDDGADVVSETQLQSFFALNDYYRGLVTERRHERQQDLVSDLIDSEVDDRPMTDDEIIAFLHLLGGAGTVTTIDLIANAWYWAWQNPDQQHAALQGAVNGWTEETLRYDSPVQMVIRLVREDVELHGATIPAGAQLLMLMGSANRDGEVFADADRYDISRSGSGQILSFSRGVHLCLGNLFARKVARIVLEELVARVADYDIDPDSLKRVHRSTVRGFESMSTTITLR